MLVIAYAIAGHVSIDFECEPLGVGKDGREVYLKDVWPTREEIQAVEREFVVPAMFKEVYSTITVGDLVVMVELGYWILEGCISQYARLLYWRDASHNTLDYCIGGMHPTIH